MKKRVTPLWAMVRLRRRRPLASGAETHLMLAILGGPLRVMLSCENVPSGRRFAPVSHGFAVMAASTVSPSFGFQSPDHSPSRSSSSRLRESAAPVRLST